MIVANRPEAAAKPTPTLPAEELSQVVRGGYCVGCGACAGAKDSPITMQMDSLARYVPIIPDDGLTRATQIRTSAACPFLEPGPNEDELAETYNAAGAVYDTKLGWYRGLYAGHALSGGHRENGSSGGITSWLLAELLDRGMVDAVVHVRSSTANGDARFIYDVSTTREGISAGAKTRYFPIEMSQVIARVRETPARYVFVGVPCFVKAVKRLMAQESVLAERIVYTASIFCGHLKSGRFAESLAWQMGVPPQKLSTVDFRHKLADRPASAYGFAVQARDEPEQRIAPMRGLAGYDWGMGVFRLSACDYCDDVVGETADISFGDAWLPAYVNDSAGTNLVIVRHPELQRLLEEGTKSGRLSLESCSPADMIKSQEPSFRHRRAGLAYRLWLKDKSGAWRPTKRVAADEKQVTPIYKLIFRYRMFMSRSSHFVFDKARKLDFLPLYTKHIWVLEKINKLLLRLSKKRIFARG